MAFGRKPESGDEAQAAAKYAVYQTVLDVYYTPVQEEDK